MTKRISLIHATPVAVQPVAQAFARQWPQAEIYNLLEDSLAPDLERGGALTMAMTRRFIDLARYTAGCGADAILFTCSAFGESIDVAAAELSPLIVLKPNEAMFRLALEQGGRIGMVATFEPSVASMEQEFNDMTTQLEIESSLQTACVPEALQALKAGDAETHNQLVAEAARTLEGSDTIMLAHFSTAQARQLVEIEQAATILSSPDCAVQWLKRQLA